MTVKSVHDKMKPVQAKTLFTGTKARLQSIQILKDAVLTEHISTVPAFLICMQGISIYRDENGTENTLMTGDFQHIEPNVTHWLNAKQDSLLILMN